MNPLPHYLIDRQRNYSRPSLGLSRRQIYTSVASAAAAVGAQMLGRGRSSKRRSVAPSRAPRSVRRIQPTAIINNQAKLKSQVKELKRLAESDQGTHIDRRRYAGSALSAVAQSTHAEFAINTTSRMEDVLGNLRYYDPSNPGTLLTADGAVGTFHKEFYFKTMYAHANVRNNYQVPCKYTMYYVQPRDDTSITALTAWTNGLTDIGAPTSTEVDVYLSDSPQFNELWKIVKSRSGMLMPGREASLSLPLGAVNYDPSLTDSHTSLYQTDAKGTMLIVRVEGVVGHDTTANQQDILAAGLDVSYSMKYEIRYPAGADIKYLVVQNFASGAFTNAGVTSNHPISDNQSYSVA